MSRHAPTDSHRVAPATAAALLAVALLVIGCASTRPSAETPAAGRETGPVIRLDREEWDYGTIERGETVTLPLAVTNAGSTPLLLTLLTSCECFTVSLDSLAVAPGQTASVMLSLQGPVVKDTSIKTLYVDSNDPAVPRVTFVARGAVKPGARPHLVATPDPAPLTAGRLTADIVIENRGREDLIIGRIGFFGCTGDWAEAVIPGGESQALHVEALQAWSGQRWLEIDSNDPVWPLKKIVLVEMP